MPPTNSLAGKPRGVQLRADDVSPDVIDLQMLVALRQMEVELQDGAPVTVVANRARLRVLPLQRTGVPLFPS